VTDKPQKPKTPPAKPKPRAQAKRQADLPLSLFAQEPDAPPEVTPEPPPPPAPSSAARYTSLSDRAARYGRHHGAQDDRPLAEQAAQAPAAPRPLAPARPYLQPRQPETAATVEPRAEIRPKALDMASIAARNRQARDAAREERPMAHPVPMPAQRPRVEKPEPVKPVKPRPSDDSMLARAARHNTLLRDEQERATALAAMPQEVKAPVPQRQKPQVDDQSMVDRAADATKRRRQALGGPLPAEAAETMGAPPLHLATTAFVLVSRNDGGRVIDRLTVWRQLVEAPDVRWWLLDLGSVDESIAHAEAMHASVISVPGGAVDPMKTLDLLLRRIDADTVLIADADALPDKRALRVLADVRTGRWVAAAPLQRPGVLAINRQAWQREGFGRAPDLATWAKRPLPGDTPLLPTAPAFIPRLLHAPRLTRLAAQVRPLVKRLRELLGR
jgi:hypothetical protein